MVKYSKQDNSQVICYRYATTLIHTVKYIMSYDYKYLNDLEF